MCLLIHPVHLVFEQGNTRFWGVVTVKFTRKLEGAGQVLGIKFRPASFYPFYQKPVSNFTDNKLPFSEVFDEDVEALEAGILSDTINEKMVDRAESFLLEHLPVKDLKSDKINEIIHQIMDNKSILKVDDVVKKFDLSKTDASENIQKICRCWPQMDHSEIQAA